MKTIKNIHPAMLLASCLILFLLSPVKVYAQVCEVGVAQGAAEAVKTAQTTAVEVMTNALKAVYQGGVEAAQTTLIEGPVGALHRMDVSIINKLDWLWQQWHPALKDMTKQLHSSIVEQTRQLAVNFDASDITAGGLQQQKKELESRKTYPPTNQSCQFDTTAKYLSRGKSGSGALTKAYAADFNKIGNADKDSPAAGGKAPLQKARWETYKEKFCDKDSNNGKAGCTDDLPTTKNMHILPSKTIFAKETIDLADPVTGPDTRAAVTELLFNITGYEVPDLIQQTALKSPLGLQQRQGNREYIAQMDAVVALASSVIADRAPGQKAPEIKKMRVKAGIKDASDNPSAREVRQAIVESLWDPSYYKELYDSPNTIPQKELYLKAYNLLLLYDMIAKQERISNVYAIETANMLDKADNSRGGASSSAPVKGGQQ